MVHRVGLPQPGRQYRRTRPGAWRPRAHVPTPLGPGRVVSWGTLGLVLGLGGSLHAGSALLALPLWKAGSLLPTPVTTSWICVPRRTRRRPFASGSTPGTGPGASALWRPCGATASTRLRSPRAGSTTGWPTLLFQVIPARSGFRLLRHPSRPRTGHLAERQARALSGNSSSQKDGEGQSTPDWGRTRLDPVARPGSLGTEQHHRSGTAQRAGAPSDPTRQFQNQSEGKNEAPAG